MYKSKIIAIAGGSGSGKTTLAKKILAQFSPSQCGIIGQDSYYIDQSHKFDRDGGSVNFDHPQALDFSLMAEHLQQLKVGQNIDVPIYDFATHKRLKEKSTFEHRPYILVDGTLILSQPQLMKIFDESIFLQVDEELRLERRLKRDISERGRTKDGVLAQFYSQVKIMHDQFVEPSKTNCSFLLNEQNLLVQKPADTDLHTLLKRILLDLLKA